VSPSGTYLDSAVLDRVVDVMLSRSGSVVLALTDAADRVPLPDDPRLDGVAGLPMERETVVDFVVPADRMAVVEIWQRAQLVGLAQGDVRLSSDPDRAVTFTVVDVRHRYGVWLGFLNAEDRWTSAAEVPALDVSLLVPTRPRTATVHKNLYAVITHVDDRLERMLGWTPADMLGHRSLDFIHPDDHQRAIGQWLEMRACRQATRVRVRHKQRDGSWLWVEMENRYVGLADPDRLVSVCELSDISDEMAAHEEVRRRENLFRRLAESLPEGLFVVDVKEGIVFTNQRLASILGVGDATALPELLTNLSPASRDELSAALSAAMSDHTDRRLEIEIVHPQSRAPRWCLADVTVLSDDEGLPGAIVTLSDVTEIALLREELRQRATYDPLTGCLNRASTFNALQQVLSHDRPGSAAILFIDLDGFKTINDTLGHAAGDELLAEAAQAIAAQARTEDVVGRIGGDEFVMICRGVCRPPDALAVAARLQKALARTVAVADRSVRVSASVGVTMAVPGSTLQALMNRADEAMYQSKRRRDRAPVFLRMPTDRIPAAASAAETTGCGLSSRPTP
jgi:diguanylate cyclase (GGDEF)-like protein/PAS domain S-box-containing protein